MSAEQLLAGAAEDLSDPNNWHQGDFWNETGTAFCALGALQKQKGEFKEFCDALHVLESAVIEQYPGFSSSDNPIAHWNDAPGREHAEVVEVFEKARALAAEKGL